MKIKIIQTAILIVILIYIIALNIQLDNIDKETISRIPCHKNTILPPISDETVLMIESVIENYGNKRRINKSRYLKIKESIKLGFLTGLISSSILGNIFPYNLLSGISIGLASGIVIGYNESLDNKAYFLDQSRHT